LINAGMMYCDAGITITNHIETLATREKDAGQ
jgi:hypothetical protein